MKEQYVTFFSFFWFYGTRCRQGICTILEGVVEESTRESYCSYFLIKTRLELVAERNELYEFTSAKIGEVEALLESYLKKEYNKKVSQRRAASVMLHIFGVRIYGYQQGSAERIREGLPWFPWK